MNYNNFSSRLSHREKKNHTMPRIKTQRLKFWFGTFLGIKKTAENISRKSEKRWSEMDICLHNSSMHFNIPLTIHKCSFPSEKKKKKRGAGGGILLSMLQTCSSSNLEGELSTPSAMTKKKLEPPPLQAEHPGSLSLSSQERCCSPFSIHVVPWGHLHTLSRSLLHGGPRTDPRTPAAASPVPSRRAGLLPWPAVTPPRAAQDAGGLLSAKGTLLACVQIGVLQDLMLLVSCSSIFHASTTFSPVVVLSAVYKCSLEYCSHITPQEILFFHIQKLKIHNTKFNLL